MNKTDSNSHDFSFSFSRDKSHSKLNYKIWRLCLAAGGGSLLVWIFHFWLGFSRPIPVWLGALAAAAAWLSVIWMLLLDTRAKWFWAGWLGIGGLFLFVLNASEAGVILGVAFSSIFLLFRKYKPFSHLSPRQKSGLFVMGILVFSLLTIGFLPFKTIGPGTGVSPASPTQGGLTALGRNITYYSLGSLRIFWFLSLFHLFVRIRLHFLRIRSKLAVIALLIAGVPLLLVTVMGMLTLYATLGETQAARARSLLGHWAEMYEKNPVIIQTLSDHTLDWQPGERAPSGSDKWLPEFADLIVSQPEKKSLVEKHNPGYYLFHSQIWLLKFEGLNSSSLRIRGGQVDRALLNRLAQVIHSDIRLSFSNIFTWGGEEQKEEPLIIQKDTPVPSISGSYAEITPENEKVPWWRQTFYFGMSHLQVLAFRENNLHEEKILLLLENSPAGIVNELASTQNPFSQVVLAALLVLAIFMLITEFFALFFGIRITSGLTRAVRKLYKGTREIARGNLDARIEIPNQDELGDLALAFNEMAVAVKEGREQAVARERLEGELKTARKIQEKLLPHEMPEMPGFHIAGTSIPSLQVGGDYFDFLDLGAGKMGVAVADVSGKGIPAALLMANLQASLHAQALQNLDVVHLASQMNELLVKSTDENMFVTFFFGILDREKSIFTSVNAGHNPPILLRKDGSFERLKAGGLILGFMKDQKYKQQTVSLEEDDVLVLFTDGVTEAAAPEEEAGRRRLFGEERLLNVIRSHRKENASAIQSAVLDAVARFAGGSPQADDITLVIIKRV